MYVIISKSGHGQTIGIIKACLHHAQFLAQQGYNSHPYRFSHAGITYLHGYEMNI